jgi:hypothetical protein
MAAMIWVASAGGALAGGTFSSNGVGHGTTSSVVYPVGEGHVVVMNMADYTNFEAEDPNNPMNGAKGPCFGEMEINKGAVAGDGYCTWVDADGESILVTWTATGRDADGNGIGEWQLMGGSGKWDGASGGGGYTVIAKDGSPERTNVTTGEITLK